MDQSQDWLHDGLHIPLSYKYVFMFTTKKNINKQKKCFPQGIEKLTSTLFNHLSYGLCGISRQFQDIVNPIKHDIDDLGILNP